MQYQKTGEIKHRTIEENNIVSIADFFEKLIQKTGGKNSFTIRFRDKSAITDSERKLFSPEVFRGKDIESISFEFHDDSYDNTVKVNLMEEVFSSEITNTYAVLSRNKEWYRSVVIQLLELLETISKQHFVRRMFDVPYIFLSYVLNWIILSWIMTSLLDFEYGIKTENADVFVPLSVFFLAGTLLFGIVSAAIYWLFPDSEFNFFTPKNKARKRIRKAAIWIFGIIIILTRL